MAFFGADGYEHQIRQMRIQLSSKDSEITSIRNELRKKDEELNDMRRSKETAENRAEEEGERAHQAGAALKQKSMELANLRLQHDNLQSSLRSANDKLRAGEKENKGLQYDNESLGFSNAEAKRITEDRDALAAKVKDLENRLSNSEETVKSLKANSSTSQLLKRSNTDFFGAALSPLPVKRHGANRRRSTSLSGDNRVNELQAELDQLRPSIIELENNKRQLTAVKKELDKVTNAKLALERSSQRQVDELNSKMEDLTYELEDWRRNDGSGSKSEVDKVRKSLAAEMENLRNRIAELEKSVQEKSSEVERLQSRVQHLALVEGELEEEKQKLHKLQSTPVTSANTAQLEEKIFALEAALEKERSEASAAASHAGPAALDLTTRQLQRQLKSLQAQVVRQNEELASQDEEINRLTKQSASRIPLPGSPVLSASHSDKDITRIIELEEQVETVKAEVVSLKTDLERAEVALQNSQKSEKDAVIRKDELQSQLIDLLATTKLKEAKVSELEAQLQELQETASSSQEQIQNAVKAKELAEKERDDSQKRFTELNERHSELSASLTSRSYDDEAVKSLQESLEAKQQQIVGLERDIAASRGQLAELEQTVGEIETQRDLAQENASTKQEEISSLMDRLVDVEDRLKAAISEKKTSVKSIKDKYRETLAEADSFKLRLEDAQKAVHEAETRMEEMQERYEEASVAKFALENQLNDLREEVANRSTESEARERDETLFDQREALEKLQSDLDRERMEHAKEIDMATFVLNKDLEEARKRVNELEAELQITEKAVNNLRLAEDKIKRLRVERDDLRINLNFVNHEQRFTSQAADAHRQALDTARADLDTKNALFASLQQEHIEASSQFGHVSAQLENDLKAATEARDELVGRVAEMEAQLQASLADHRTQAEEAQSLVSDLALARCKASRAESEVLNLRHANKKLEVAHDKAQALLEAKMEAEIKMDTVPESPESQVGSHERPGSAAGHRRRRSAIYNVSMDMYEALKIERADLAGRLSRRDARIRDLETEIKQIKLNLHLASESAIDSETEREEVSQRYSALQAEFEIKSAELLQLQESLNEAQGSIDASKSTLSTVEARVVDLERDLELAHSDARVHERSLQEVIVALAAEHHAARVSQRTWTTRLQALEIADASLDRIQLAATAALVGAKEQINDLSSQLVVAQEDLSTRTAEMTKAKQIEQELRTSLASGETTIAETSAQLSRAETDLKTLRETAERIPVLEKEMEAAKEQIALRQTDIEDLLGKLASAERFKGIGEKDAAILEETKAERDTLLESLSELEKELSNVQTDHVGRLDKERSDRAEEVAGLSAQIEEMKAGMEDKTQALIEASTRVTELERHLEEVRGQLEQAGVDAESQRSLQTDLETRAAEVLNLETQIASMTKDLENEKNMVNELRASLADHEARVSSVHEEKENLVSQISSLEKELAAAQLNAARYTELNAASDTDKTTILNLHTRIETLNSEVAAIQSERDDLSLQIAQADVKLAAVISERSIIQQQSEIQSSDIAKLNSQLGDAKASLEKADRAVIAARESSKALSVQLSSVQTQKRDLDARLVEMQAEAEKVSAQRGQIDTLREQVSSLQEQLEARPAAVQDSSESQELKDRISELETSLSLKVQEVDEADDKVKDIHKEKVKLEKKIAKLQRQLAAATSATNAETAANTAANKHIAAPVSTPMEMPPPAAPRSLPLPNFKNAGNMVPPSPRQPLRPVNVFSEKILSPGLKRAREEKSEEKPGAVDMILLPPAQLDHGLKSTPRSFKPMRKVLGENVTPRERVNVFAEM